MTAGRGVIHAEMPVSDGRIHGLQLWVNLKSADKMVEPQYQELKNKDIPKPSKDGVTVAVISGEAFGVKVGASTYASDTPSVGIAGTNLAASLLFSLSKNCAQNYSHNSLCTAPIYQRTKLMYGLLYKPMGRLCSSGDVKQVPRDLFLFYTFFFNETTKRKRNSVHAGARVCLSSVCNFANTCICPSIYPNLRLLLMLLSVSWFYSKIQYLGITERGYGLRTFIKV